MVFSNFARPRFVGPRTALNIPVGSKHRPKTAQEAPKRPQYGPCEPQDGPTGHQHGPRETQDGLRGRQYGPHTAPTRPKGAPKRAPRARQESPNTATGLQDAPRQPKRAPTRPKRIPSETQNNSNGPQVQAQEAPATLHNTMAPTTGAVAVLLLDPSPFCFFWFQLRLQSRSRFCAVSGRRFFTVFMFKKDLFGNSDRTTLPFPRLLRAGPRSPTSWKHRDGRLFAIFRLRGPSAGFGTVRSRLGMKSWPSRNPN